MKICTCCKVLKPITEYDVCGNYIQSWCKLCNRAWHAARREAGEFRNYQKEYQRRRRQSEEARKKDCEFTKAYYRKNKLAVNQKGNARRQAKIKANPDFRMSEYMRARICLALKGNYKSGHTLELLGCSIDELRSWLSGWFQPGMTWENYGLWHIDHRMPCASFDLSNPEQQRRCFHYLNLQPLWAKDNLSKGAKTHTI